MHLDFRRIYKNNGYGRLPERPPCWVKILRDIVRWWRAQRERRSDRALIRSIIRARGPEQIRLLHELDRRGLALTTNQREQADLF